VGVRLADDGLRSSPQTRDLGSIRNTRAQVSLPLRARSRDKPRSHALWAEADWVFADTRFWPQQIGIRNRLLILAEGRGSGLVREAFDSGRRPWASGRAAFRLADDGLRSRPETKDLGSTRNTRAQVSLPLRARSRTSHAPTPAGQKPIGFSLIPASGRNRSAFAIGF
jgi:hypothetical protein